VTFSELFDESETFTGNVNKSIGVIDWVKTLDSTGVLGVRVRLRFGKVRRCPSVIISAHNDFVKDDVL
jgi:hypothetical protein